MISADSSPLGLKLICPDGEPFTLDWTSARVFDLKAGKFSIKESTKGRWYIIREASEDKAYVYDGDPEDGAELVKTFCWDRFSPATGIRLDPGDETRADICWA